MTSPISKYSAPFTLHRFGPYVTAGARTRKGNEVFQPLQNEVQALTVKWYTAPSSPGGSVRLAWNGSDAGWVAWPAGADLAAQTTAFAAAVQAALATIPALAGNVVAVGSVVTDSVGNVASVVQVTFQAGLANAPQPMVALTDGPITSSGAAVWSYCGRTQHGIAANTPLTILGSFQPLNPREVALLPEGERATETAKFYTETAPHMLVQATAANPVGTPPDWIETRGRFWEVQNITQYNPEFGMPYFKVMLNLVEVD